MAIHCQTCGVELATWTGKCPNCGGTSPMQIKAPQDPMLGKVISGKYKITKKLGQGGMGSVYLAENVGIGQKVAIKFLNPSFFGETTVVTRFLNEARSYGQLSHPHAVQLHEHGQDEEGNLFISMEYIEGQDLKHVLDEYTRLPMKDALDIALQICDVLSYAHGKGIVHRDLKPENIMLTKGLSGWHAKVLDFGVARLADGNRVTAAGSICGTPRYMAPEQAEGKDIDHRVDIYALGLVTFECLTGNHPFIAASIAETMRRQVMEPMPHIRQVAPDLLLPDALDSAIQKAVAKDPAQRFASMAEFAKMLVAATPTSTVDASLLQKGMEQEHTVLKGASFDKSLHEAPPVVRRGGTKTGLFAALGAVALLGGAAAVFFATRPTVITPPVVDFKPIDPKPDPGIKVPPELPKDPDPKPADPTPDPKPADPKPADPKPENPKLPENPGKNPKNPGNTVVNPKNPNDGTSQVERVGDTALLRMARADFASGRLDVAVESLKQIPVASGIHSEAAALQKEINELNALMRQAEGMYAAGDCKGAIPVYKEIVRRNGNITAARQGETRCEKQLPAGVLDP